MPQDAADPFGVYIHIPFCASKCDYCAFATWTDRDHLVDTYLDTLELDITRAVDAGLPVASTVFVGGGTPTLVPPERLAQVIAAVPVLDDAEVTVECNPDDVNAEMLQAYRSGGVNRVSVGVQSMSAHVLAALGRTHDRDNVARTVEAIRSVEMPSFNLDIIYGAAGETVDDWTATVREVVAFDPPHVSAYGLTVEAGTPLATQPDRHPDDDDQADKYVIADRLLTDAGLVNYEVSNWAKPGHESSHNFLYWRQQDYRGFGCAAHSHRSGRRWWNVRTPERYIDIVRNGGDVEASAEVLDDDTRRFERLQLLLRTRDGVAVDSFTAETRELLAGLVVEHPDDPERVVLTPDGRLMANEISMRFA
ncbi:radical SAM family heme chaperone HemW [Ilumatobacter nonamiensis]|uniref:radical SAM family heme chaperone HemW n=1 Tax=Ilumatobacter nonamiensis TaxID=467093 RepID=UPI00034976FE|nr:radical SAM family heme chaperone HemW [Ilumatobacter nonamiensis]